MKTRTRIVGMGNSHEIRVSKLLLDQPHLPEEVELRTEPGRLVVSARRPRAGWGQAAQLMKARGESFLLDEPTPTKFDDAEGRANNLPAPQCRRRSKLEY